MASFNSTSNFRQKFYFTTLFYKLLGTGLALLLLYLLPYYFEFSEDFLKARLFVLAGFLWIIFFSLLELQAKSFKTYKLLGEIELNIGTIFLGLFLLKAGVIWSLFFIFSFLIIGAAYNFSKTSPYIIALIGVVFLVYDFVVKQSAGPIAMFYLVMKSAALLFWAWYGGLMVEALTIERAQSQRLQKLYQRLKASYKKLKLLDKAKDNFIEVTSHQIRTPIALIEGMLSMALRELNHKGSFPTSLLEKAYDGTIRMQTLVKNLLSASRIEVKKIEVNWENVDIVSLAQSVYEEFKIQAKNKKLKFSLEVDKTLPFIKTDGEKVKEIMEIFVDNALKYTLKGYVKMSLFKEKDKVVFLVKDTGIGVPKEFRSEIFKKFSRAENIGIIHPEGTGLGLFIAKVLIKKLKGQLVFQSQEGKGSTFGFKLPLA